MTEKEKTDKYYRQFFRFLKENNAFTEWEEERIKQYKRSFYVCNSLMVSICDDWQAKAMLEATFTSFCWDETPQGILFWGGLSRKWGEEKI